MEYKLENVFDFIRNGASIKQGIIDGGYPITRIETIANSYIDLSKMGYSGIETLEKYENYLLKEGDILMSHINSEKHLGKTAIYENIDEEIIHGMNLLCLRPNRDKVIPKYINYYFNSVNFRIQLPNITKKSVNQASFSVSDLKKIKVSIPELETQVKIAGVLDKAQELIDKRKAQIEALDELVKSKFIEMFGDPVKNTKNWDMNTLSEIGSIGRGVSKHRPRNAPELLGGEYPLIQTGDVANAGLYIKDYNSTYSELGLKQSKLWNKGTLCITIAANIAKTGILTFDACFPDSVVGFIAGEKTNNIFMYYWFSSFQKLLEEQAPESAQKNINLKILSDLKVIVPPIELQNKFADFVNQIDKLKFEMHKSLQEMENNFNSLMQRAFKGELLK